MLLDIILLHGKFQVQRNNMPKAGRKMRGNSGWQLRGIWQEVMEKGCERGSHLLVHFCLGWSMQGEGMLQGQGFSLAAFNPSQLFCCFLNMMIPLSLETASHSVSSSRGTLAQMLFYCLQTPRERIHGSVVDPRERLVSQILEDVWRTPLEIITSLQAFC